MLRVLLLLLVMPTPALAVTTDMYIIRFERVRVQALDEDGKPAAGMRTIEYVPAGTIGCALDVDPKGRSFEPRFEGRINELGKLRTLDSDARSPKGEGAPRDVVSCVVLVLANNPIRVPPGRYRVLTKVRFKKTKYELR